MTKIQRSQSGMAVVELALLLGLLVIIMIGTIDFARLYYSSVTVADAARAGTQYGLHSSARSGDFTGMENAASENAQDIESFTPKAERFCRCADDSSVDCVTGTCTEGVPQVYIRVKGQNTFETLTKYPGIPEDVWLSKRAVFRVQ